MTKKVSLFLAILVFSLNVCAQATTNTDPDAAIVTLAISPAAMLPPFRLSIPVRPGSTTRIGAAMERALITVVCYAPWTRNC